MTQKPKLYYFLESQPSRSVLLTAAALGIDLDLITMSTFAGDHLKPEFIKINPQHTLPTLDDNGIIVADSHAICAYLSDKYGKDDRLYPKDLVKRALVNSRLHFNCGHLLCRIRFLYEPVLYFKSKDLSEEKIQYIQTAWEIMERFLENSPYVCGEEMTIADLCCVASVSSVSEIAAIDPAKYPKLLQWVERLSQLPYYEEKNAVGARNLQADVRRIHKANLAL